MRIGNAEDAKGVVRKYFLGTRTLHGNIVSPSTEEETEGPDEKVLGKSKEHVSRRAGVKEKFTATVSSRGEDQDSIEFNPA